MEPELLRLQQHQCSAGNPLQDGTITESFPECRVQSVRAPLMQYGNKLHACCGALKDMFVGAGKARHVCGSASHVKANHLQLRGFLPFPLRC